MTIQRAYLNEKICFDKQLVEVGLNGPTVDDCTVFLSRAEIKQYNRDPDRYAATHFGFDSVDEYREWVETMGAALCSERTRTGALCRNSLFFCETPADWRWNHRSMPCRVHAKKERDTND